MKGRDRFVARVDRYVITFYPLAYLLTTASVTMLFRQVLYRYFTGKQQDASRVRKGCAQKHKKDLLSRRAYPELTIVWRKHPATDTAGPVSATLAATRVPWTFQAPLHGLQDGMHRKAPAFLQDLFVLFCAAFWMQFSY
jgi:hypothetical protein